MKQNEEVKPPRKKAAQKAISNVIVMVRKQRMECWGSLAEICRIHGFNYHTLKKKKFPFIHDGWVINKIPFREKLTIVKTLNEKDDAKN